MEELQFLKLQLEALKTAKVAQAAQKALQDANLVRQVIAGDKRIAELEAKIRELEVNS
jgi:hypothetical protein